MNHRKSIEINVALARAVHLPLLKRHNVHCNISKDLTEIISTLSRTTPDAAKEFNSELVFDNAVVKHPYVLSSSSVALALTETVSLPPPGLDF